MNLRAICVHTACLFLAAAFPAAAQLASPFQVSAAVTNEGGVSRVVVGFTVPAGHYLYADQISVAATDAELAPVGHPKPHTKHDAFMDAVVGIYDASVALAYEVRKGMRSPLPIEVRYQGCSDKVCFLPQTVGFSLGGSAGVQQAAPAGLTPAMSGTDPTDPAPGFRVTGSASGYLDAEEFTAFLAGGAASGRSGDAIRNAWERGGYWITLLLILAGGLALNLTPCVLPMIPINIAIIGAGVRAGSRGRGFLLGGVYGLGIALAYGVLGLAVVLTGAKFGSLNASPVFNFSIAALFLLMAAAMFGAVNLDFSRFQSQAGPGRKPRGGIATAFVLGAVAALMAGACVAPVLISVLLLAADLHAAGRAAGILLPFVLGLGMALPWPFAGAGLSFLPRPGGWMEKVKYGFGAIILAVALWYGWTGVSLLRSGQGSTASGLQAELAAARQVGKPVLLDFWATWCKNCHTMEKTTFRDPRVRERLGAFTVIKFQAEDLRSADVRSVMNRFGAIGLPTYVLLDPAPGAGR